MPPVPPPIGFALLGCGRVFPKHLAALAANPAARLVAVCDRVPERAAAAAARAGVPGYTDLCGMLRAHPEAEVVSILTPSGLHAEHGLAVAEAGRHVVVEKPMSLTVASGQAMIEACGRAGVRLFVIKQNRFNKAIARVREAFDAGALGRLVLGTVRLRWCRTQAYYDHDEWRGTWALDGGVLANNASHHVDMLRYFLGDPEAVFARTATRLVDIEAEDTAVAILRYPDGALGAIEATTGARPRDLEASLSLLGEGGTIVVGGLALNEILAWDVPALPLRAGTGAFGEQPPDVYGFGHHAALAHVCDCLRTGRPALVDGAEGLRTVRLLCALYESAERGCEVRLDAGSVPAHSRLGSLTS